MNDTMDRLRAADPTRRMTDADPGDPPARALLARVFAVPQESSRRPGRRRLVAAAAGATVAAAATAFFVTEPAAAYTVDRHADGSVGVSFRAARLKDTRQLNAELARAGARTVVIRMVPADRCTTPLDMDPAFPFLTTATPAELDRYPVSYQLRDDGVVITIRPDKMPDGDTLAFGYSIRNDRDGRTTIAVPAVVRTLPTCMAIPNPPRR
ncbi:hypothetical protein [Dactylosporangium siamense]|uniref:Uncharacterized protein n=1 Tax=Dactylosporangium siamense TaxID=685454 RepID=A0A919PQN5_9ACTN|nr:hypothetical protein [Dactylosporangium siamense]GIG49110.1 hypothetical protein Dsi01nite_071510 [Dactylosporangium siamense]